MTCADLCRLTVDKQRAQNVGFAVKLFNFLVKTVELQEGNKSVKLSELSPQQRLGLKKLTMLASQAVGTVAASVHVFPAASKSVMNGMSTSALKKRYNVIAAPSSPDAKAGAGVSETDHGDHDGDDDGMSICDGVGASAAVDTDFASKKHKRDRDCAGNAVMEEKVKKTRQSCNAGIKEPSLPKQHQPVEVFSCC